MGEVWRARDTRLGREVALKVLPERLASDADALARFEREARALAALSHARICTLHDVGRDGDTAYLVMELLAGETLAQRLARGPLPLPDAIAIGVQVAEALAAAHRLGIVHRDLKPGNVMLTRAGVKLLDFGLAKRRGAGDATPVQDWQLLPTRRADRATPLTAEGSLLGTLQYMAPEQLEGGEADGRSDLFALGAILHEMVSGERAFGGSTPASVIAAILKDQPRPLLELVPLTPPALDRLVRRCLEKEPELRWQSAADVAEALRWLLDPLASGSVSAAPSAGLRPGPRRRRPALLAAAAALAALAFVAWAAWTTSRRGQPLHVAVPLPGASSEGDWFQLSPDGGRIAWVGPSGEGSRVLWVRSLRTGEERRLAGTENAVQPFWSPDGGWLGFFADGKLQKVPVAGGPTQALASAPTPFGGSWGRGGVIAFAPAPAAGLQAVAAEGGPARPLTALTGAEEGHRWPCFLPDGERFVFLADSARTEDHRIRLGTLAGGAGAALVQAVSHPTVAGDHLLYVHSGTLLAQRLDLRGQRLEGDPVALAENVDDNWENHHYELSAGGGSLTWRATDPRARFVWLDRHGAPLETVGPPGRYAEFELSPDGRRLAYAVHDANGRVEGIWWRDLARGVASRVVASRDGQLVGYPVWAPAGDRIAFAAASGGRWSAHVARVGDPAPPVALLREPVDDLPLAWSADGRFVALGRSAAGSEDLWVATVAEADARPFADAVHDERRGAFSPDGRWLAFVADPSGRREVYLRRFPEGSPTLQVSHDGGDLPAWRGDGREIYFVSASHDLVAVTVGEGVEPALGEPRTLFGLEAGLRPRLWWQGVAPAADGSRFLALEYLTDPLREPLHLLVGWRPE